ncbi:MAG: ATP-binding protein [Gammaproteobacteria bacterium]|nr:ATP-binding protein [Gammaproteobacteria bacterium]
MIERRIRQHVTEALDRQAAVALIGPRQVGKTTLAQDIAEERDALYLDLEDSDDREKLSSPGLFLKQYEDRLVVLDEIHRVPELFQTLRGVIDQGRRKGKRTGRFLILGSASTDLLRQSGESLAGRIEYVDMQPLDVTEAGGGEGALDRLWIRGGFPDSFLAKNDPDSLKLRRSFIRTYLERDVPQFGPRIPAETLERLWTMLAHGQGTLVNASRLASGLSLTAPTVTKYIDLLVDLLLVRRLPPLHANIGKRLVKSPKVYVRDSGLVHALLGIEDYNELAGHPVVGTSWEGFVIENLLAVAPERTQASFYRTSAGAEIDLVLELPGRAGRWAIEIKRALSAKPGRGFYQACEDIQPDKSFVVYAGEERYPVTEDVQAIGVLEMAQTLLKTG